MAEANTIKPNYPAIDSCIIFKSKKGRKNITEKVEKVKTTKE